MQARVEIVDPGAHHVSEVASVALVRQQRCLRLSLRLPENSLVIQLEAARQVVAKGMTVRQTESLVLSLTAPNKVTLPKNDGRNDANIHQLEEMLSRRLGAAVQIKHGAGGKGSLTIKYTSLDELDGILAHIK